MGLNTPLSMSTKGIICVKSFRIRSFSCPYFPVFGLNMERYGVSLRIQSECREMRTRKTPNKDTFLAVYDMNNDDKLAANRVKSNCVTLPDIAGGILCYQRFIFYFWCKEETRSRVKYAWGSCLQAVDSWFERLTNI